MIYSMDKLNQISSEVVDAIYSTHKELGAGLLENVYEMCLCIELDNRNIKYRCQVELPIIYKGKKINSTYRIDILIEDSIILELKSVENLLPIHQAQLLTYLKLSHLKLGFLVNFNVPLIKNGIKRMIN